MLRRHGQQSTATGKGGQSMNELCKLCGHYLFVCGGVHESKGIQGVDELADSYAQEIRRLEVELKESQWLTRKAVEELAEVKLQLADAQSFSWLQALRIRRLLEALQMYERQS
jgi:hypothetical protein